jgi:exodeoxyribonuclease VII large subunit
VTLPFVEETYRVSQLCDEIRDFLGGAFSSVWVAGEVERLRESGRGHLYFELVEKGERDDIRGKLDAVLWRTDHDRVRRLLAATGQRLAEGTAIRCRGNVDFYGPAGRLQLVVREVDPVFTLGLLARRRRETLAALEAAGLVERNRALPLPPLPLTVALITSLGSAAYHDFLAVLAASGFGFRVLVVHAAVQGREAERELVSALEAAGRAGVDCAVLVRGGGAASDLAVFDGRAVAAAVAACPVPVVTGLGHEIDRSIADLVAHTALATPTKAAEFLVERVAGGALEVAELRRELRRAAVERLRAGRERLARAERGVELGRLRLAAAAARLGEHARALARLGRGRLREADRRRRDLAGRLAGAGPRLLGRRRGEPGLAAARLVALARGRLREARAVVAGIDRLAVQLVPARTLGRGYSITRDAAGRLLKRPDQVAPGDRIATELAGGRLASRVEEG